MTTIPTIDALPTPVPQTSDPTNFDERADVLLSALPTRVDQMNAQGAAMNTVAGEVQGNADAAEASAGAAAGSAEAAQAAASMAAASAAYFATSASGQSVTTGAKTFTGLPAARAFQDNDPVVVVRRSDRSVRLYGTVNVGGYNAGANSLAVTITSVEGSGGPFTDWLIFHAVFDFVAPASAADMWAGTSASKAPSAAAARASVAFRALTDGPTVSWNIATQGVNVSLAMAATGRVISAPTGLWDGCPVILELIQPAGGGCTPVFDAIFDFQSTPTVNTGANKVDYVFGIYRAARGKIVCNYRRAA